MFPVSQPNMGGGNWQTDKKGVKNKFVCVKTWFCFKSFLKNLNQAMYVSLKSDTWSNKSPYIWVLAYTLQS